MLLMTMVYVAVFAYVKPYRSSYVNIIEVFTLADIVLLILIASTSRFKVELNYNKLYLDK